MTDNTSTLNLEKIILNDDIYFFNVKDGFSLYQICLMSDYQLPRFCFHSKLSIAGNCRVCLVEIANSVKLVISCAVIAESDMEFFTDTKAVKDSQESVFEYLLINHPLDCPICDQGGECDLQDQVIIFGSDRGRFYEDFKRSVENGNYGPLIKVILNRCIHCARCTRFLWEIAGSSSLIFVNRGESMQIGSYISKFINNELSGNIIDLCPVGALTSKPYAFAARIWELYSIKYIDIMDATHSSITINFRGSNILRIIPTVNEFLNEDWISDKIRFFYDSLILQRLIYPFFLYHFKKVHLSWLNSLYFLKFYFFNLLVFFFEKKKKFLLKSILSGDFLNCQELIILRDFSFNFGFSFIKSIYCTYSKNIDFRNFFLFNTQFSNLDTSSFYFLIAVNPRYESPALNIKLKQLHINSFLVLFGFLSNCSYLFIHLGTNIISFINFIENTSSMYKYLRNFFKYFWIFGAAYYYRNKFEVEFFRNVIVNSVNILHNNSSDIQVLELNLFNNIYESNKIENINFLYNFIYGINNDNSVQNFNLNSYTLPLYQGPQGDYFIKYAKLIFPTKLFLEKSSIFINLEGLVQDLRSFFFRYNFKTIKTDSSIFFILFDLLRLKNKIYLNILDDEDMVVNNRLKEISAIFYTTDLTYFYISPAFNINIITNKTIYFNKNFGSLLNNFYLSNSLVRNSRVLSLCSKFYTIYNEFKYLTLN